MSEEISTIYGHAARDQRVGIVLPRAEVLVYAGERRLEEQRRDTKRKKQMSCFPGHAHAE